MIKTKIVKESLLDWSVESTERLVVNKHVIEKGSTLAWITKDRLNIFTVTYTKNLFPLDISADIRGKFVEAKEVALQTIDFLTKD
jgi:hypothetical protein